MLKDILTKFAGRPILIDERVPITYVFSLFISKLACLVRGFIHFHQSCFISSNCIIRGKSLIKFGKGFSMEENCYVDALSKKGLICGDNVHLGFQTCVRLTGSLKNIGQGMRIGNNVGLGSHGFYGSGMGFVEIGDDCIFGNYVSIHPENHNYKDPNVLIRLQGVSSVGGVKIGKNCWIGAKVTILDGAEIGDNSIVAAGAVVKGKFPASVIIGGVPARIIKEK